MPLTTPRRVPVLDALRGLAITLVLLYHWIDHSVDPTAHPALARICDRLFGECWVGVDLFFVLSGFLIGGIILDHKSSGNFFQTFYMRRACRILPLYVLLLVGWPVAIKILPWEQSPLYRAIVDPSVPVWPYLTFTQDFTQGASIPTNEWLGVTWSLAIEEQFYLLAPAILAILPFREIPKLAVWCLVAAFAFRVFVALSLPNAGRFDYATLPARMDTLMVGVVAAWAVRDPATARLLDTRRGWLLAATAIAGALAAPAFWNVWRVDSPSLITTGYPLIAIFLGLVLLSALKLNPNARGLKPLCWMGSVAYPVYLFHRPLGFVLHAAILHRPESIADVPGVILTLLALLLVLALGALSWRFVEMPMIRFGHRWRYSAPSRAAGLAEAV